MNTLVRDQHHTDSQQALDSQQSFDEKMTRALLVWGEHHAHPNRIILRTGDGRTFTPRQLASEVSRQTPFGKTQLRVLRNYAVKRPRLGFEGLIEAFACSGRPNRSSILGRLGQAIAALWQRNRQHYKNS